MVGGSRDLYRETVETLREAAAGETECVVAFSGGKDSLTVLSLAAQVFKKIVPLYLYLVPHMAFVEKRLAIAKDRFGLDVMRWPVDAFISALKHGHYRPRYSGAADWPEPSMGDSFEMVSKRLGIPTVIVGRKWCDFKRRSILMKSDQTFGLNPIASWSRPDVIAYLKRAGLPLPESSGDANGEDLTAVTLLWIAKNHPDDFKKLCKVFPFAPAVVYREKWYGEAVAKP